MSFRHTSATVAAFALAGLLGLSACSSTPSPRRVALDTIEALELPAAQEQCMKDVIGTYSNDELEAIGNANDGLDFANEDFVAAGSPEYQEYVERLQECRESDGQSSAESTEPSDSAAASETTEAAGTTEAADTTEVAETTEAPETTES